MTTLTQRLWGKDFFKIGWELSKTCNLCLHHADFVGSARNPAWRGWKERLIEWEKQVSISRILTFFHSFWAALVAVLNDKNISDFQNCFLLYHCFGCDKDKWTASEGSIWTTKIMFFGKLYRHFNGFSPFAIYQTHSRPP